MTTFETSAAFRAALLDAGLLTPLSVDGLYVRSATYERIVQGVSRCTARAGAFLAAEEVWLAPVMPRAAYERTAYHTTFSDLAGSVSTFTGGNREHAGLLRTAEDGGDWTSYFAPSELMLCSAGCHPVYETLTGTLVDQPRYIELEATVFRHEPSTDPMRMQSFRQHEFVYVGAPEGATRFRDDWATRGLDLLTSLGLEVEAEVANDPFFGRLGQVLASSQRETQLKVELLVSATSEGRTAVASANCHLDHFAEPFDIRTADGAVAHSACVGMGLDRIALALLAEHGFEPAGWPVDVRRALR